MTTKREFLEALDARMGGLPVSERRLQVERRTALHGDGRAGAQRLEVGDGERTCLDHHIAGKGRSGRREDDLARAALHEPCVVADRRAVRVRLARVGRHDPIRSLGPRAAGKRRQRGHHRAHKGYLFHLSALLLLGAHRFRGAQTSPSCSFTCGYHITILPFLTSRFPKRESS